MTLVDPDYKTAARSLRASSRDLLLRLKAERTAQRADQLARRSVAPLRLALVEPDARTLSPDDEGVVHPSGPAEAPAPAAPMVQSTTADAVPVPVSPAHARLMQAIASVTSVPPDPVPAPDGAPAPDGVPAPVVSAESVATTVVFLEDAADDYPDVIDTAEAIDAIDVIDAVEHEPPVPGVDAGDEVLAVAAPASIAPDVTTEPMPAAVEPVPLEAMAMIGPGLRWRLKQLGVASVNDLAVVDIDWLRRELGAIGVLVNIATWRQAADVLVSRRT